jgi:hypothetical protein
VARFLAGAVACFLMMTGAFLLWQGHAQDRSAVPPPPSKTPLPSIMGRGPPQAPVASDKSREAKRFDRADKNRDGKILLAELLQPRQKAFAKLDTDKDGKLSFEEWAHTTIDKFRGADADRNNQLNPTEYATTAPKPHPKPKCGC